jgi:transcription initiation factor TFIID subunit 6
VKHVLSKELQQYYEKIIESVFKKETEVRKAALNSLRTDAGIHQLIPYFCQFVSEKITKNLKNLDILWSTLRVIESLLNNPNLFMEPYVHFVSFPILFLILPTLPALSFFISF